jgi:SNF2 family DNA or RNA helicase
MLTRDDLRHYQQAAYGFAYEHNRCALFLDMGLGKTVISLTLAADLLGNIEAARVLIVGPKRVVRKTWPDEIKAWEHLKHLSYTVIDGTEKQRERQARESTSIHLISRDNVRWLLDYYWKELPYDVVIIDESSSFRNSSAKRWMAMRLICSKAHRTILLTGTPAPNGLHQLWGQITLIDGGQRLKSTYGQFKELWFNENTFEHSLEPKAHAEAAIHERIKDICFTLRSEDYLELPPITYNDIKIELEPKELEQYKTLETEAILEVAGEEITAFNAGALAGKLLQYANGAVYVEDKRFHTFHDAKIEALKDIVDAAQGEPVLVAYNYKSDLARLKAAFPDGLVIDSDDSIDAWNSGFVEIAFAHPASVGVGLNLQKGGAIMVWFGLTWDLELYLQLIKRIWRSGQEKPVVIHHLVAEGTIDETVIQVIRAKDATQSRLLNAMKKTLEKVVDAFLS